jgi:hypothetical protein
MYLRLAANPKLLIRELASGGLSKSLPPFSPGLVNRIAKLDFYMQSGFRGEHPSASEAKSFVGPAWCDYHKFCVVRNPWDHAVSDYHWRASGCPHVTFKEFLYRLNDPLRPDPEGVRPPVLSNWQIYAIDNHVAADTIIFYEKLTDGLKTLAQKLGIPLDISEVKQKTSFRASRSITEYYDNENIELVRTIYNKEIAFFGYQFPVK